MLNFVFFICLKKLSLYLILIKLTHEKQEVFCILNLIRFLVLRYCNKIKQKIEYTT